ncbi:hypothetical protein GCM10009751_05960 [Myceligenerans crystallogenes]|uniref:Uncharacterized protein n=1 Tax=Myceligenerans crystallogenes TaxID=316335 RepID=A0ABP4ZH23_9MICO
MVPDELAGHHETGRGRAVRTRMSAPDRLRPVTRRPAVSVSVPVRRRNVAADGVRRVHLNPARTTGSRSAATSPTSTNEVAPQHAANTTKPSTTGNSNLTPTRITRIRHCLQCSQQARGILTNQQLSRQRVPERGNDREE